jgi:hypothetical protein
MEQPNLMTSPVLIGFHELFHFCVSAGSIAFFVFILRYVINYQHPISHNKPRSRMSHVSVPNPVFGKRVSCS